MAYLTKRSLTLGSIEINIAHLAENEKVGSVGGNDPAALSLREKSPCQSTGAESSSAAWKKIGRSIGFRTLFSKAFPQMQGLFPPGRRL